MKARKNQPTLDDVAELAGVSATTVSRYFNKPHVVARDSAERIRQAVLETGYTPNLVAGTLASNRSRLVSILIPQLYPSLFIETIEAMVKRLSERGNVVTVGVTEFDQQREIELIRAAMAYRAKAIITSAVVSPESRRIIEQSDTIAIEIWDIPDEPIDVAIGFSHYKIGRKLAQFVKSRGYRRPHFASIDTPRALARRKGFEDQWKSYRGQAVTEEYLDLPPRFEHSRLAFAGLKRLDALPDVVICGSDWLAAGLVIEAVNSGLKVPDDLAVIGFGNSTLSMVMRPPITTVDLEGGKIAGSIIEILDARDRGEEIPGSVIEHGFSIIARESA